MEYYLMNFLRLYDEDDQDTAGFSIEVDVSWLLNPLPKIFTDCQTLKRICVKIRT